MLIGSLQNGGETARHRFRKRNRRQISEARKKRRRQFSAAKHSRGLAPRKTRESGSARVRACARARSSSYSVARAAEILSLGSMKHPARRARKRGLNEMTKEILATPKQRRFRKNNRSLFVRTLNREFLGTSVVKPKKEGKKKLQTVTRARVSFQCADLGP